MKMHSRQLIAGQVAGQLALVLAIPFLTRLLPQEDMGIYQVSLSVALVLQPLATLRRELVIPVSSQIDARKHRLVGLGFSGALSLGIGAIGLLFFFLRYEYLATVMFTTMVILFSFSLLSIENAYLIRYGFFRRLALRSFVAGSGAAIVQIAAGMIYPSAFLIGVALLVGRVCATLFTMARVSISFEPDLPSQRRAQRSLSSILSAMAATASSQAIVIGSFATLGPGAAAQIGIGQRISGMPATLIGQALTQIALGSAAPYIRNQKHGLTAILRKQTVRTSLGAGLMAAALIILGPILAVPFLGPGWELAGTLIAVFSVPLSLQLVALPATTLLIPLGQERLLLALQLGRLVAIAGALSGTAYASGDVILTCVVTSLVWTFAYAPILSAAFMATLRHDRHCLEE